MSGDFIAVWERVTFEKGEPTKWERSMDKGKTWEAIHWPFGPLPFVLFNAGAGITSVTRVLREEA
jgi:hypothetical protein